VLRNRPAVTVLAALCFALIALVAVPAFASAEVINIESAADEELEQTATTCETAAGTCTLRAAIELANENGQFDVLEFDSTVFNGEVGSDEVLLGSALPAITEALTIVGFPILDGSIEAPGPAVAGPAGGATFTVEADGVTIQGIAIAGGKYGIEVPASFTGFIAKGNWFGLKLDATPRAVGTGILLGEGSDEATIGGTDETTRNVFANAEVGIKIEGASETKVLGNYIGVGPTGAGAASLEVGVRVVDTPGFPAEENEIGGALSPLEVGEQECVGPCNVIATDSGRGIDLAGNGIEAVTPASGPTVIRGNYVGLGADGTALTSENVYGVIAAPSTPGCANGPADVTVGGFELGEGNFIEGGSEAIFAEAAENFSAIGNSIGIAPDGSAAETPQDVAIGLCDSGVTEPAIVVANQMILGPDTIGVESVDGNANIIGNVIEGSFNGILTAETGGGVGNLIVANAIIGADVRGIWVKDDSNELIDNSIFEAGRWGIVIEEGAEHNRIGGDLPGEPNTIVEVGNPNEGDAAIIIFGDQLSRNEIAANTGFGNAGAFIELIGQSGTEIPNGLKPPVIAGAMQSSASGTAAPETTVRVFSKASPEAGELGELLAVVRADAAGAWTATFPQQPTGTLVVATQTSNALTPEAGTSALSAPVAAQADPAPPVEPAKSADKPAGGNSNPTPIPAPAPKVPKVKITVGPKKSSTATTAKFKFKAEPAAGAKFECKLDNGKWAKCGSPKTYKKLAVGKHTFRVKATAGGLTGPAAVFKFTIKS
jgi:hypothetical protein